MNNEMLLILNLIFLYIAVLVFYKFLGSKGLIYWTMFATICANIEVLIMVDAFGMSQTLGNIMFATTFVVTDILSELEGKEKANEAVKIGIITSIMFILVSQFWLLFTPNSEDWAFESIKTVFHGTPRLMIAGIVVYAIVQKLDIYLYHKWWNITIKIFKDERKGLWIRNNGSTLISQLLNTFLFTVFAFYGVYDMKTLTNIFISSYIIFICTSLLDTPVVYIARMIKENKIKEKDEEMKKEIKNSIILEN